MAEMVDPISIIAKKAMEDRYAKELKRPSSIKNSPTRLRRSKTEATPIARATGQEKFNLTLNVSRDGFNSRSVSEESADEDIERNPADLDDPTSRLSHDAPESARQQLLSVLRAVANFGQNNNLLHGNLIRSGRDTYIGSSPG
jgi:hypothetical protein